MESPSKAHSWLLFGKVLARRTAGFCWCRAEVYKPVYNTVFQQAFKVIQGSTAQHTHGARQHMAHGAQHTVHGTRHTAHTAAAGHSIQPPAQCHAHTARTGQHTRHTADGALHAAHGTARLLYLSAPGNDVVCCRPPGCRPAAGARRHSPAVPA